MANIFAERIATLRGVMERNGWDAVVVSGSDPHGSEYPAPRWQQVKFLSGFTGEAGDLVVTQDHAGLWTDSRYFIQALTQLEGTGVELHKTRVPGAVGIPQWLSDKAKTVAIDGLCWNVDAVKEIAGALGEGGLVVDVPDMLEDLWDARPQMPMTPITTLDVETFGGRPREEKISWLRKWMLLEGVDRILLTSLDEIAWMLNVRGSDIEYNPLVISYLLVFYREWSVKSSLILLWHYTQKYSIKLKNTIDKHVFSVLQCRRKEKNPQKSR
jgi:Xaa-Pro aminopeptidase